MLSMSDANCCKILCASEPFLIGGYSGGIYLSSLSSDGSMTQPVQVNTQANPSFLCLHPSLDVAYVVTETQRNDQDQAASSSLARSSVRLHILPTATGPQLDEGIASERRSAVLRQSPQVRQARQNYNSDESLAIEATEEFRNVDLPAREHLSTVNSFVF